MDARSRNKALFRSKLNALKEEKRIESPLVRYNESDQPVCRVCDLVLKSESFWDAHQASRKHHEAIANLKANATTGLTRVSSGARSQTDLPKARVEPPKNKAESSAHSAKPKPASGLPPDFFDADKQKHNGGGGSVQTQAIDLARIGDNDVEKKSAVSSGVKTQPLGNISQKSLQTSAPEKKQAKEGAIPEGFFDNKDADMHARGIKPVKIDVKDEYKEFEKLIQADLQEVDDRMEEEEIDAAEMIEEAESMEQKAYRERVESLRKKRLELKEAARSAKRKRSCEDDDNKDLSSEGSSSGDDDDNTVGNFAVDWRAQHL